jgi:hypothetical protein
MKKFISILSLAAIVASALFVSCAQKKEPTLVTAFPYNKTATYVQNEDSGEWAWSWASADGWTAAKDGGFGTTTTNHFGATVLEYRIDPNAAWTAEVVGQGKEYVEMGQGFDFDVEKLTWGSTASGDRGKNSLYFRVLKTPESYEEAVEVEVALTMVGETMVIATLVIEPTIW